MRESKTARFLGSASVAGLALAAFAQPAFAQVSDGEDAASDILPDVIVVTARGREESLQDVPESIIAFNADDIEARGIVDIQGVFNQTPNLCAR
ncbi:MAG: hypothetical protein AAGL49_12080 [Pseudomonadota bacterium]